MTQADSVHSTPPINTSATDDDSHTPESPQDALYLPTDISPEEVFKAIGRLRKEARDEIHRLIRFLDESDNHMELEEAVDDVPCDDNELDGPEHGEDEECDPLEHSLGALERHPSVYGDGRDGSGDQSSWTKGKGGDLEDEHDGREPDVDDEPSLCGITADVSLSGGDRDLEGPEDDREPSLGWPERIVQTTNPGGLDERELSAEPGSRIVKRSRKAFVKNQYRSPKQDGMHIDVDPMRIGPRNLKNMTDEQKEAFARRMDRDEVRLS